MITKTEKNKNAGSGRYASIDELRGLAILNMILYHALWDLVYLFGYDMPWYRGSIGFVWQQYICFSFILISGFCQALTPPKIKRGLLVFFWGLIITAVTVIFMPEGRIIFGVLTFLGSAGIISCLVYPLLKKCPPVAGLALSAFLFVFTRNIAYGYLGAGQLKISLPDQLYSNYLSAFLGFPAASFYSADYFPIVPWIFLFMSGYFLGAATRNTGFMRHLAPVRIPPLAFIGRHSLLIYVLHQPLVYALLYFFFLPLKNPFLRLSFSMLLSVATS